MKCKTEVLLMNGSMSVGQCTGCKRVGVHFNNLLAGFSQAEFKRWAEWLLHIEFAPNSSLFHDGQFRIILDTGKANLQFTFTESEFNVFRDGIAEALLQMQVRELMAGE